MIPIRFMKAAVAGAACGIGLFLAYKKDEADRKKLVQEYLEEKYGQEFEVTKAVPYSQLSEDVLYMFSAKAKTKHVIDIEFFVGVREHAYYHELMPATYMDEYFDTFYDDYVWSAEFLTRLARETSFDVNSADDVESAVESIVRSMGLFTDMIDAAGFDADEYAPSTTFRLVSKNLAPQQKVRERDITVYATDTEEDIRSRVLSFFVGQDSATKR